MKLNLTSYSTLVFDCDGVVWRGIEEVSGASNILNRLLTHGKKVIFVTNNNSMTRKSFKDKVEKVLGISVSYNQLYSSGISAGLYVKQRLSPEEKIFLIGSKGFSEIMDENEQQIVVSHPRRKNHRNNMKRTPPMTPSKSSNENSSCLVERRL